MLLTSRIEPVDLAHEVRTDVSGLSQKPKIRLLR